MENNEKIVQIIKIRGPVLPSDVSKIVGTNLLFTSAILSELVTKNQLKLSHLKIGGSPLYYTKGQEYKLQQFSDKLHEKEKIAYDLLKDKKILRDSQLEPVIRVALRQIKDFAIPLQVDLKNKIEIFWKWYLISNEEALSFIKTELKIPSTKQEIPQEKPLEKPQIKPEKLIEPKQLLKEEKRLTSEQKKIPETKKFIDQGESFHNQIIKYFEKNNIRIIHEEVKKKKSDFEFILEVPTSLGNVEFFCKAKNKKLINDKDLAIASIQGQAKKLPVLFLTKGKPTKKASEMLLKEFKTLKIKII